MGGGLAQTRVFRETRAELPAYPAQDFQMHVADSGIHTAD